jgi:hypothetical protein
MILRAEIQGTHCKGDCRSTYDAVIENESDLTDEETQNWGIGSMAFVLDGKALYIKTETGWTSVTS